MIILCCGHQVNDIENAISVAIKGYNTTHEGVVKAVFYKQICKECFLAIKDDILATERDEFNYIFN